MMPDAVARHIDDSYERSIDDLSDFLRIPSISPVEGYAADVRRAARWLADHMKRLGIGATMYETSGHPIVYGEVHSGGGPTLMFYAHYDVTPPGRPEEWATPPFSPVFKQGH
ncbi:MAG TPA: peptidase, partial [Methanocella sp.]|nr:peptidase [Methanocella sp.]